jgi:ACS family hexuronate transporter-like MFS transporter
MRRQFALMVLLSLPLAAVPYVDSYPIVLALFFSAMFMSASFTIGGLAYASQHYSTSHSGFIAGIGTGSWSAVIAVVLPVIGRLFDEHSYRSAFALATGLPVAGYALWRLLDRAK